MHIKNQINEDRRIYVRVMFRLKKMLRDACDYCKTLWDRFRQLIDCDNDIGRCSRGHCLGISVSKETWKFDVIVRSEVHAIGCETFTWGRFRQLIDCDNGIGRCFGDCFSCFERALKVIITMVAITDKALTINWWKGVCGRGKIMCRGLCG